MANICSRGTLTAMLAEKENDAVLSECPDRQDSASFCGQRGFKTLQSGFTLFHNKYLHMKGPPMTFVFHHGGLFKKNAEGDMVYKPDNTEVLIGVEGDTLDVFFKDPGVPLSSGLRSLVTDADLVAMCKDCRRNHNLINIYLKNCISQPCIVDQIEEEVVNVEAERLKQGKYFEAKKCSSQPVKKLITIDPQSNKQTSYPNRTTSQPKSQPNPTMKPISEPNQPKVKPMSQPNKAAHQPKKTTALPMKPVPQAKKISYQAKSVPPQSNSSSEAANNSQGEKDKQNSSGCRVTRSGRQVKEAPLQEDDTDFHDSYESTEDELYRPPKVVRDNLYSSDSDSDSGKKKRSGERDSRSEVREKQKPPKKRLADKEIDTDDSNYEGSKDEESSESDLDDSDAALDADSWHSEDSDKVLESDEESPAVYPQFNEKTKFGELKFELPSYPVSMPPSTSIHHSHYQPAAQPHNLSLFHLGPPLHTHHPQPT
ncbi:hypothetical protein Ahy_B06g081007 [Arachis hypogaea]|uniref:PB1-like domain-containing protein n=1 Tax=Arachis hypogaea TaxID=3818 RepID=A0A444YJU1_ARAHY|nr:hypothetical protein Ahy_B06g081007 [Arachis hypogaea]